MCERVRVREIVCISKNKVGCVGGGGLVLSGWGERRAQVGG